jgi:ferric-dicitrate binding protein FerR (iron transport regulator)
MTASLFFLQKSILYRTYQTPYAQTQQLTLSDGTEVVLNANSTLYVPRWGQFERNRKVLLDGEAEFHVTHTIDNQRFVVKTSSDFEVEVFGTKFVLYAREQAKKVILNEGKVQVKYRGGKKQFMKPGDVATLATGAQTLDLSKTDDTKKYSAWKDHQFYFDDTPLVQASITIKEHFGLQLAFDSPALADRRLSGYFKAAKSAEFFEALSVLLNVDVRQQGDTIYLSTK